MAVVEETDEDLGYPTRSHMWKHEAMVDWINETEGIELDTMSAAEIVSWAFAKRAAWRNSAKSGSPYRQLLEEHKADAAEQAAAAKVANAAARAAKAAAKAKEEAAAPAKAPRAAKAAKAAPAKATKAPAKAAKAAAPAKATRATRATKKAAASDSPFD